ncbi:MAG: hypothetical protein ACRDA6_04795, partial [Aeromonas veronii]
KREIKAGEIRRPIIIKGRQGCRRGDGILRNLTPDGPFFRWAGSMKRALTHYLAYLPPNRRS